MNYKMLCEAKLEPVGQGGFYTAMIAMKENPPFTLVYDCGSLSTYRDSTAESPIESAVGSFCPRLAGRPIDMLVISHFDADHVNGLDLLLPRGGGGAVQVFIPYLLPLERMLAALRYDDEKDEYYQFLASPITWLTERGVKQVIVVGGSDDDNNQGTEIPEPDPDRIPSNDTRETKNPPKLEIPFSPHSATSDAIKSETGSSSLPPNTTTLDHRAVLTLNSTWRFRFFQNDGEFAKGINAICSNKQLLLATVPEKIQKQCRQFIKAVKEMTKSFSPSDICDTIRDGNKRKAIKAAYGTVTKTHNDTSLCLWHGPSLQYYEYGRIEITGHPAAHWLFDHRCAFLDYNYNYAPRHRRRLGTLLTGDITLKNSAQAKFITHYKNELPATSILTLPHHGSFHSWESHSSLLASRPWLVLSAGIGNKHGHPDLELVEELEISRNLRVLQSHQRRPIQYKIISYL